MNWGYDHTLTVDGWFSPVLQVEGWWDDEAIADGGAPEPPAVQPQTVLYMINVNRMGLR